MTTLYGIKNCDTVKRARRTLEEAGIAYRFHDFRGDGLDPALLQTWLDMLGAEALINRRGTTWRRLSEKQRQIENDGDAVALMLEHPGLIRRPVIDCHGQLQLGFPRGEEAAILRWIAEHTAAGAAPDNEGEGTARPN